MNEPTQAGDGGAREREPTLDDLLREHCDAMKEHYGAMSTACNAACEVREAATDYTPQWHERDESRVAPSELGEEGARVILDPVGSLERATRQTIELRSKGIPCDDVVDGLLTTLLAALAPKDNPVAEYQWRSTKYGPGKGWNGSKEEVESHAKVGCETRELCLRPAPIPVDTGGGE